MSGPRPSGNLACRAGVLDGAIKVVLEPNSQARPTVGR